ncbi:hypothetical protein BABINDRAFT_6484 [Babjeviella inositovora NRRL Y-12698]|uniref:non-specific serine/threonine protein kinase n=1 Tax=Babjeviella inositovora NRRL Y-12698 TaxID=984486 RepID=A0A1E3QXP8_9ASCO|nr:uncharacterized protein BABINDRAFT_6484 [Babjeviella inositovora NRRL Y-12698]ODQ81842.1 hypothetical protein BABINDRAFT_6484 [Babjeviella inositovora NRRL Y-12698]
MLTEYKNYKAGGLLRGQYRKVSNISEGSYGIVTLAQDAKHDNRLVAVKYITENPNLSSRDATKPKEDGSDGSRKQTNTSNKTRHYSYVLREAKHEIEILKIIGDKHPNITALYDHFDAYIVLEYCARGDLYEAIRLDVGPSATSDVIDVMCQLMDGIEFVHSHNIFHRDIKPENILISDDWTVKLTDWGLATTQKMCTDFDIGSERYMAPELFDDTNLEEYDASKVDIWALGVCMLNVVFHKNPFQAANASDKSFVLFSANRDFLFDMFANMSYDMFGVLRYSLTLDPENRDLASMRTELLHVENFTIDHEMSEIEDNVFTDLSAPLMTQGDASGDTHLAVPPNESQPIEMATSPVAKFIRNSRKPLAIPSTRPTGVYRPNINNPYPSKGININNGNNYNLQDHFTPKSVFNRYMDKIDQNKETVAGVPNSFVKPFKQPRNWKRRPWNRNRKANNTGNTSYSGSYNGNTSGFSTVNVKDGARRREWFPGETSGRRSSHSHSNSYSNSHSSRRSSQCRPSNFVNVQSLVPRESNPHARRASLGIIYPPSSSGKYVPPNLRSPLLNVTGPIEEDKPHHDYDLDDEVFLLEDDFEASANELSSHLGQTSLNGGSGMPIYGDKYARTQEYHHEAHGEPYFQSISSTLMGSHHDGAINLHVFRSDDKDSVFKKPNGVVKKIPDFDRERPHSSALHELLRFNANHRFNGRHQTQAFLGATSPPRNGAMPLIQIPHAVPTVSLNSERNLYIPPNRRQSHSAASNTRPGLGETAAGKLTSLADHGSGVTTPEFSRPVSFLPTIHSEVASPTSTSVPIKSTSWFKFHKSWDEYDDDDDDDDGRVSPSFGSKKQAIPSNASISSDTNDSVTLFDELWSELAPGSQTRLPSSLIPDLISRFETYLGISQGDLLSENAALEIQTFCQENGELMLSKDDFATLTGNRINFRMLEENPFGSSSPSPMSSPCPSPTKRSKGPSHLRSQSTPDLHSELDQVSDPFPFRSQRHASIASFSPVPKYQSSIAVRQVKKLLLDLEHTHLQIHRNFDSISRSLLLLERESRRDLDRLEGLYHEYEGHIVDIRGLNEDLEYIKTGVKELWSTKKRNRQRAKEEAPEAVKGESSYITLAPVEEETQETQEIPEAVNEKPSSITLAPVEKKAQETQKIPEAVKEDTGERPFKSNIDGGLKAPSNRDATKILTKMNKTNPISGKTAVPTKTVTPYIPVSSQTISPNTPTPTEISEVDVDPLSLPTLEVATPSSPELVKKEPLAGPSTLQLSGASQSPLLSLKMLLFSFVVIILAYWKAL